MVARTALTDLKLRSLPIPAKGQACYWDSLPGFGVRVSQGGSRTFLLKHKNRFITLGRYHPDIFPLSKAREEAKRVLAEFTLGKVRPGSITFDQACKLFVEDKRRSKRKATAEGYKWLLARLRLSGQLMDITHADLARGLSRIKSRSTYDHALVAARIFFNWCMKRRYISDNPTLGISPHGTPKRCRVLSDDELKSIWRACGDASARKDEVSARSMRLPAHFANIVKLLILTGQRRGEIAQLQPSWITHTPNTSSIVFPASVTKNGREHHLPVSSTTAQLALSSKRWNGWSKSKKQLDKLSGVTGWTLHDLRRTYRTIHARIGTPPHIAERLVNHVSSRSAVEEIYDRHSYADEMRKAVVAFEAHLQALLAR